MTDLILILLLTLSILGASVGSYFIAGASTILAVLILVGCLIVHIKRNVYRG